jgi:hypothetical protein
VQAFSTTQVQHLALVTPIILDLNGDGVHTLSINSGVSFDVFAQGQSVHTGWVSSTDGLLVMDRNGDGTINDGTELFGSATRLANGEQATDGYVALKELDSNGDGVVSADDALFAELRVWVDSNSDGLSAAAEIRTLTSLGITSINTQASADVSLDNGNLIGLSSTYETADGATHAAADVWFVAEVPGTRTAPALDSVAEDASLRTRVSSLAQVMGAFGNTSPATNAVPGANLSAPAGVATTAATLAVVSMVDVMKQFDANGSLIGAPASTVAAPGSTLAQTGLQNPASAGWLAIGSNK